MRERTETKRSYKMIQMALFFILAMMMTISFNARSAKAGQTYTVSVASGYLALRTAPAYDDRNEIGALYSGETVEVTGGYSGEYVWIYSPKLGRQGYVNANYLIGANRNYTCNNNSGYGRSYTVSVASGYLALRTAAAYDDRNEIGSLYSGETVQYAGSTCGEYWWVYSPKYGRCGYVNSNYLY